MFPSWQSPIQISAKVAFPVGWETNYGRCLSCNEFSVGFLRVSTGEELENEILEIPERAPTDKETANNTALLSYLCLWCDDP